MWYLASLLAFCLCVSSQIVDVDDWVWLRGRMEDIPYTQTAFVELKALSRFGVVSSQNFEIFDADQWYIGFSDNFDQITHNIDSMLVSWDLDSESFSEVGAQPRPTTGGLQESWTSIYYFSTSDGTTWAFHAFIHADDPVDRYPDPITLRGDSLLYQLTDGAFEDTPSYRVYSQQATTRTTYFATDDGREFLWTANFAPTFTRTGTPNCTIHEYKGGSWGLSNLAFNCTKFPRSPLVFTNNLGEWLYIDVAYATATWKTDGTVNGALNMAAVPQKFYTYRNNGLYDADVMDNLAFTNVNFVEHFADDQWDYIVALTNEGIATSRLHWTTHRAQELPLIRTSHVGTHMHMFDFWNHTCLSISYGDYPGLTETTPSVQDTFFVIYCWDSAHDRWNLVQRVPSFGVIKTETFVDQYEDEDPRTFLVALANRGHLNQHSVTVYEMTEWYTDEFLIQREVEAGAYEQSKLVNDIAEELDDIHHYKAMIIATLSLLATVFILQLLLLVKGMSGGGGGGGGGGDYQSFS